MGYKNDALTYSPIGSVAINHGRALKLVMSSGSPVVREIEDADADVVVGWALSSRAVNDTSPVPVRMMYEGTINCEFDPARSADIVKGTELYLTDEGLVTDQSTDSPYKIGWAMEDAANAKYIECLILRQYPMYEGESSTP